MLPKIKQRIIWFFAAIIVAFPSYSQITLTTGAGDYLSQPTTLVSYAVKKEGVTNTSDVLGLTAAEKTQVLSFMDGFGRPLEQIIAAGTPGGKDLISFNSYDEFGRQPKQYLPYEGATGGGVYVDPALHAVSDQYDFFTTNTNTSKVANDADPFSQQTYEASPLQRMLKQGGVGDGFQTNQNYKTINYRAGTSADGVLLWSSSGTSSSSYGNNDLMVTELTDENSNVTKIYKDKSGKLILKSQQRDSYPHFNNTYYIYDNLGNLIYIVPPKAYEKMVSLSSYDVSNCPNLIFQFWYDGKNRVIKKKVPGAAEVYLIYDSFDRAILSQDGNMRSSSGKVWSYVKYDNQNRVIIQGLYTHSSVLSQSAMQSYIDGLFGAYDSDNQTYEKRSNTTSGYTNTYFPTSSTEERQYFYYDDYDFNYDGSADYDKQDQSLSGEATATSLTYGLPTGTKKKILSSAGSGTWLTEVNFYDKYYHVIQMRSNNQLTTTVSDHVTNVVSFTGKPLLAKQYKDLAGTTIAVNTRYEYDDMERLTKVHQTNPGAFELTVAKYEYNALGQVIDKKLNSTNGTDYLQSVDYRYNIRGQLASINNAARTYNAANNDDGSGENEDLFGMELFYNNQDAGLSSGGIGNSADYTGMISGVKWSAKTPSFSGPDIRSYVYAYDNLYRLTSATYRAKGATGYTNFTKDVNGFNESMTYDENGNIATLQRNSVISTTVTQIDDLTYTYTSSGNSNQLDHISDAITTTTAGYGFRNIMGSSSSYTYDDNGNLLTDPKKGLVFTYNELSKPTTISNSSAGVIIVYRYDAAGTRLSKYVYSAVGARKTLLKSLEYVGGFVVQDGTLSYFGMAEGRVRNDGSNTSMSLKMEYFISDHQGNVRISFEDDGTSTNTPTLKQENSYYAFGMQMAGGYTPTSPNRKLYNAGSEWQEENALADGISDYYSTFFREYDPVIGRFNSVDPKSEADESLSVYAYSENNPVNFNDPNGDLSQAEFDFAIALAELVLNYNVSYNGNEVTGFSYGGGGEAESLNLYESDAAAFAAGSAHMDATNSWGSNPGWATSLADAKQRYTANGGTDLDVQGVLSSVIVHGKIKNNKWQTSYVDYNGNSGWSQSFQSVYGDHHLRTDWLPANNNPDVQVGNLCVFKTMQWIGRYYNSDIKTDFEYVQYWCKSSPTRAKDGLTGFSGSPIELSKLLDHFFDQNKTRDITKSINKGYPVFGFIANPAPATDFHAIMITGYNNDGSIVYFDPETGLYDHRLANTINYPMQITGLQ